MILEQCKNLLETNATVIAHQVNCRGVMGAGVAKLIRSEIISDSQYEMYQNLCKAKTAYELMSHNKVMSVPQGRIMTYVVNMFAEDIPTGKGLDTDYKSLYLCLQELENGAWIIISCTQQYLDIWDAGLQVVTGISFTIIWLCRYLKTPRFCWRLIICQRVWSF